MLAPYQGFQGAKRPLTLDPDCTERCLPNKSCHFRLRLFPSHPRSACIDACRCMYLSAFTPLRHQHDRVTLSMTKSLRSKGNHELCKSCVCCRIWRHNGPEWWGLSTYFTHYSAHELSPSSPRGKRLFPHSINQSSEKCWNLKLEIFRVF
jgi:hypothetical protein